MDSNWWNNALQSYDVGRQHRQDREYGEAFQSGGYEGVEQAAGNMGDMRTAMGARRFQDDQRQQAYERMQTIAPWARNAIRATRNMDPQRAAAFLQQNQQRFLDFGFTPEQVAAGIAGLSSADPNERAQWQQELDAAFTQHENPDWQLVGNQAAAIDPASGEIQLGGRIPEELGAGGRYATPDEVSQAGYRPGTVVWLTPGEPPRVIQQPSAARSAAGASYPDAESTLRDLGGEWLD